MILTRNSKNLVCCHPIQAPVCSLACDLGPWLHPDLNAQGLGQGFDLPSQPQLGLMHP